jgi:hypothetical protein
MGLDRRSGKTPTDLPVGQNQYPLLQSCVLAIDKRMAMLVRAQHPWRRMRHDSKGIIMSVDLPKAIELFMSSENAHDADALAGCFAPDATVRDEGRTRKGLTDIAAWRRETTEKYHHTLEPLAVAERDGKMIVAMKVAGDFPGSPITLDFVFRLKDGKISSLEIQS